MNQEFVLGKLCELMGWDADRSRTEFAWLRLMSRMKYDTYQDFLVGMRFIESLVDWLQQFAFEEREVGYQFVRKNLVFIGPGEMRHVVELFYPETVQPYLARRVAENHKIREYRVWADQAAAQLYKTLLRKTLFIELSDGARIDVFRRSNAGVISNEQVVTAPRIISTKWNELLKDLRKATGNAEERFAFVYLVDDFIGSGYTLLRERDGSWEGKLIKFWEDLRDAKVIESHFESEWTLCVHHYIATTQADETIRERDDAIRSVKGRGIGSTAWSTVMARSCRESSHRPEGAPDFAALVEKYYDDSIETEHMKRGGDNARLRV